MHLKLFLLPLSILAWETLALPTDDKLLKRQTDEQKVKALLEFGSDVNKQKQANKDEEAKKDKEDPVVEKTKYVCDSNHMTKDSWIDTDMDKWIKQFAEDYPKNTRDNGVEIAKDSTFVEYIAQLSGSMGNFVCNAHKCEINFDTPLCKDHPILYFAAWGIKNFQGWKSAFYEEMSAVSEKWSNKAYALMDKFMKYEYRAAASNAGWIIVAGIIGMASAFMGPVGGAIGGLVAGGLVTIAGSISAQPNTAMEMVEKRFRDRAEVSDAIGNIVSATRDQFLDSADKVMSATPYGGWDDKDNQPLHSLLGGKFGDAPDKSDYDDFEKVTEHVLTSSIIGSAWFLDQVFIVKCTKTIANYDPCTAKLDFLDDVRVCIDDVAYVFVRTGKMDAIQNPHVPWVNAVGYDKLKDYDLSLEKMVHAAEWFEKQFKGKQPSKDDLKDFARSMAEGTDGPPDNLWLNLPIIDYEKTPSLNRNYFNFYGNWDNPWARLLNNCHVYIKNRIKDDDGWPYKKFEGSQG